MVSQLAYQIEIFYQKDQTSLVEARRQLAVEISASLAQKLRAALLVIDSERVDFSLALFSAEC